MKRTLKVTGFRILVFLSIYCSMTALNAEEKSSRFLEKKEVQTFIKEMVHKYHFSKAELTSLFRHFIPNQKILQTMKRPYEAQPWFRYQANLVTEERAKAGVEFWKEHQKILQKAEKEFGVPAEIIVAILGVETYYGKKTGNFPVFEALATLAFAYPPRAAFFRSELEHFLLLTRSQKLNPRTTLGSYAGAMGTPQFMPSSYRRFAVDFTHTGKIDLMNNIGDAIGSVGNYFKMHGWKSGESVVLKANVTNKRVKSLGINPKDIKPRTTLNEFRNRGVKFQSKREIKNNAFATLIALDKNPTSKEYWLTLHNFYVITRYNHSTLYAMAVYELSQRIKSLR
jgi:membrane-bound lytic murein transglycosylase B